MDNKILKWLEDIDNCIDEINDFLPAQRNFLLYQTDLKTKKAVERNIEIIGEAVRRILVEIPEFPINDARRIVDTRNRIIHGYDTISDEIIWSIIVNELPRLKIEVSQHLKNEK